MKLGVFDDNRLGALVGEETVDVTDLLVDHLGGPSAAGPLHALIESAAAQALLTEEALASAPRVAGPVRWRAPLPRPGKIPGAPANYRAHVAEMGNPNTISEWGMFLKASSSVIGPGEAIELPYTDVRTDHEGELAVVIGRTCRNVSLEDALDVVFGYTCLLDITTRSTEDRSTRKSYDTFTPLGPLVVTSDEIEDPDALGIRLWVGEELRQDASTAAMIFGVRQLIAYTSSVMTLHPGDVIATGTPEGVGPIVDGDVVTVEIEAVGTLTVTVSAADAIPYADRPRA